MINQAARRCPCVPACLLPLSVRASRSSLVCRAQQQQPQQQAARSGVVSRAAATTKADTAAHWGKFGVFEYDISEVGGMMAVCVLEDRAGYKGRPAVGSGWVLPLQQGRVGWV